MQVIQFKVVCHIYANFAAVKKLCQQENIDWNYCIKLF